MKPISITVARKLGYLPTRSASKHGNKKTPYNGRMYDSIKEANYAASLDQQMHARGNNRVTKWEPQVRYPLVVNGVKICDYYLDFKIEYADGTVRHVDVKGIDRKTKKARTTDVYRLKKKLMLACYDIELEEE